MRGLAWILVGLSLCGCAKERRDAPVTTLTEHQRDSVLSRSGLPGSRTVGRAMHESDRAAHRSAALDTLTR